MSAEGKKARWGRNGKSPCGRNLPLPLCPFPCSDPAVCEGRSGRAECQGEAGGGTKLSFASEQLRGDCSFPGLTLAKGLGWKGSPSRCWAVPAGTTRPLSRPGLRGRAQSGARLLAKPLQADTSTSALARGAELLAWRVFGGLRPAPWHRRRCSLAASRRGHFPPSARRDKGVTKLGLFPFHKPQCT